MVLTLDSGLQVKLSAWDVCRISVAALNGQITRPETNDLMIVCRDRQYLPGTEEDDDPDMLMDLVREVWR